METFNNNKMWQFQEESPCETHEIPQDQVQGTASGPGQSPVSVQGGG